ncbi:AIR synthase-related protein [Methanopyrus kandleri]|uniref:Selenophosphate synthetase-related enzyme n=2 Tax=Methanopyrus kandleri TaxID=2320 RepID=Q8TV42_METKA|nr:AIR synthase-related protein [Methanopyrus kandleri]AAM02771.1 Selenophosphate synthetase-related enzyme [Methanopyrus kandleri AV19]HII71031.1 hypothetical protein [Methanopyrus kandleri]
MSARGAPSYEDLRRHVLRYTVDDVKVVRLLPEFGRAEVGLADYDDAAVVRVDGKLVVSSDGPYAFRLVRKSALVHASTDVLVAGGEPRFAVDTIIAPTEKGALEAARRIGRQARALGIEILGGNTMIEDDVEEPKVSLTVMGPLVAPEPITDCGAEPGDSVLLVGEPIHGSFQERMERARRLFDTFPELARRGLVKAAKDVTKGGLVAMAALVCAKSGVGMDLNSVPYSSITRNWDNVLAVVSPDDVEEVLNVCAERGCPVTMLGEVIEEPVLRIAGRTLVDSELMAEIEDHFKTFKNFKKS